MVRLAVTTAGSVEVTGVVDVGGVSGVEVLPHAASSRTRVVDKRKIEEVFILLIKYSDFNLTLLSDLSVLSECAYLSA